MAEHSDKHQGISFGTLVLFLLSEFLVFFLPGIFFSGHYHILNADHNNALFVLALVSIPLFAFLSVISAGLRQKGPNWVLVHSGTLYGIFCTFQWVNLLPYPPIPMAQKLSISISATMYGLAAGLISAFLFSRIRPRKKVN